jgi:hypothetical protein
MPSRAQQTGAELVLYSDITERRKELNQATEASTIGKLRGFGNQGKD